MHPPATLYRAQISLYVAFMAREDEKRAAAATRSAKREVKEQLQGQAAQAAQRKCGSGAGWVGWCGVHVLAASCCIPCMLCRSCCLSRLLGCAWQTSKHFGPYCEALTCCCSASL